jgi:hypothetical protein
MNKVIHWGRWCAAAFFAFQGLFFLFAIEAIVVFSAVELHERMLYPAVMAPILSFPLLACAWGIVKLRRWGYGLAIVLAVAEGLAGIVAVWLLKANISSVYVVGFSIYFDPAFMSSLLFAYIVLLWLLLPSVRTRFLHKGFAA